MTRETEADAAGQAQWMSLIDAQLGEIFTALARGFDIAPARRFQLEGLVAAAHAHGIALEELQRFCLRNAPANCDIRIDAQRERLLLDFWQQRAPVYPSTRE